MQGSIRCVCIAGLLLGCDPGDTNTPIDSRPTDTIVPGESGLVIEWSSAPSAWPSTTGIITLVRARFMMSSLRVVGDAGPGDTRTTQGAMELGYAWSSVEQRPTTITFNDAPTGLYSQVAIAFDGGSNDAYQIRGEVDFNGSVREFRIEDANPLTFNVVIDEMVTPGEIATVPLRINFTHALDTINWSQVDISDGRYELEDGDSQMPAFRLKLIESFEIVAGG
jgi:hypothetical protein